MSAQVRKKDGCPFCVSEDQLTKQVPLLDLAWNEVVLPCNREVATNDCCIVTLAPEQYAVGHAIAILRNHADDLTDPLLTAEESRGLIETVRAVASLLKRVLRCPRVYIVSLCDGVVHLHYHLIPRYDTDVKGFNYIGDRETQYNLGNWVGPRNPETRVAFLEDLARRLKNPP